MNRCGPCGEDFATVAAFDEHRVGFHAFTFAEGLGFDPPREDGRRCFSTAELKERGWAQDTHGRWMYPRDWDLQAWRWDLDPSEVEVSVT